MRTRVLLALTMLVVVLGVPSVALACAGHEVRATNTLNDIYGQDSGVSVQATGDHYITVTLADGSQATFHSTEEAMVRQAIRFIEGNGIEQGGSAAPREVVEDYAG